MMMLDRRAVAALVVALVTAACGGSAESGEASTTTGGNNETTTTATSTAGDDRPVVGRLTLSPERSSFLNGREIFSAQQLKARDRLSTDESGLLVFQLARKIQECRALPDSSVQLQPSDDVLVQWVDGVGVCVTNNEPGTVSFGAGDRLRLQVADPVFTVTVHRDQTRIDVDRGFVLVEDMNDPGRTLLAAPQQAAIVTSDGEMQGPAPISEPHARGS